jgi:frataxin-like iron-binding protein CyaY
LNKDKIHQLCYRIITGYQPVIFLDDLYIVYDPKPEHYYLADIYCENIKEDFVSEGLLSQDESVEILIHKGLWSPDYDKQIDFLSKDFTNILRNIKDCQFKSNEKKRWEELAKANRKKIEELSNKKNTLLTNTIEYLLKIEKYKYLLFLNTYKNNKRVWENEKDFYLLQKENIVNFLLKKTYLNFDIDSKSIRLIARNDPWRVIWRSSTKTGSLFKHSASEMTEYQKELVTWSILYDGVYESLDCPDDSVIENDDLLDAWLIEQQEKRSKEKKDKFSTENAKINNSNEIGIVVDSPEDAEKVYNLNDRAGLQRIKDRQKALTNKGTLKEHELPDMKRDIKMMVNQGNFNNARTS